MPMFEYVCELCGEKTTKIFKYPPPQDIKCPHCEAANTHLVPSATAWRPDKTVQGLD